MLNVLLVLQILIAVFMVGVILIQRTDSDGLSGIGGGGGGNSLLSGNAKANALTRVTALLAAAFMINSLVMATITTRQMRSESSIADKIEQQHQAPGNGSDSTAPATQAAPTVPMAR
jgi:preprotein translocase subunit SecG